MPYGLIIFIAAVAIVAVALIIRYILYAVINKSADAIHNAIVVKKNKEKSNDQENLADRYRK